MHLWCIGDACSGQCTVGPLRYDTQSKLKVLYPPFKSSFVHIYQL